MDYLSVFNISASGMDLQRARLETMAANLANAYVTSPDGAATYRPLDVVGINGAIDFDTVVGAVNDSMLSSLAPVEYEIVETDSAARLVFEPDHPHANADGFVAYPNINPVNEMVKLMTATRAYEANAQAINAAKSMAATALQIGRK